MWKSVIPGSMFHCRAVQIFKQYLGLYSDVSPCPCPQGLLKDQNEVHVLVLVLEEKSWSWSWSLALKSLLTSLDLYLHK